jgi:tetratricopeptide (TPR) repeat protein
MQPRERELLRLVEQSLAAGDMRQAIAACRGLNTQFPECFEGWCVAGKIHLAMRKPDALLFSSERALALRPDSIAATLQRLEALIGTNDLDAAIALLEDIAMRDLGSANRHDVVGRHMASLDMHEEAREQFARAVDMDPENAVLWYNLATEQRFTGDIEAAETSLDRSLALDPLDFEAQAMRSSLRRQTPDSNHVAELVELLDDPGLGEGGETSICYALAKEFDDLDEPASSFAYLQRGATARRQRMDYDVVTDVAVMEQIRATYPNEFFSQDESGYDSEEPIFIIGLPRTGTTLIERILGSHSQVFSAGELDNFGRQMVELIAATDKDNVAGNRAEIVRRSAGIDLSELGRRYVESTRPMTGHTARFIDKLPFNYLYAGLIHKALPAARTIEVRRHPMAACYAIFKQLFRDPYPFSYDLEDLATYYIEYRRLMDHWHQAMPGVMHVVYYEDVVEDAEAETRRLLEFCGLGWEEGCLRFYESAAASTTASASQVRQPIYRRSLDRWQSYREHLAPLEKRLNDAGLDTEGAGT